MNTVIESKKFLNGYKSRAKTVKGILRAAVRILEENELSRANYYEAGREDVGRPACFCTAGAIRVAIKGSGYVAWDEAEHPKIMQDAFRAVAEVIRPINPSIGTRGIRSPEGVIITANDKFSKSEAIGVLLKTIDEL